MKLNANAGHHRRSWIRSGDAVYFYQRKGTVRVFGRNRFSNMNDTFSYSLICWASLNVGEHAGFSGQQQLSLFSWPQSHYIWYSSLMESNQWIFVHCNVDRDDGRRKWHETLVKFFVCLILNGHGNHMVFHLESQRGRASRGSFV